MHLQKNLQKTDFGVERLIIVTQRDISIVLKNSIL